MGIGMTMLEETIFDSATGRIANATFGDYLIPVNADVPDLDVVFAGEPDRFDPVGIKGLGEIGIVGVSAAIRQRRVPRHRPANPLAADHHRTAVVGGDGEDTFSRHHACKDSPDKPWVSYRAKSCSSAVQS
jgi:hypothetical protein